MLIATLAFLASTFQPMGDGPKAPAAEGAAPSAPVATRPEGAPEPGTSVRLVGDASVKPARLESGEYRLADMGMVIEAPLPDGYPAPTPPGMIELKTYPVVRRAVVRTRLGQRRSEP